ncbi:MAG: SagB/ThcOx family dehydrogenase [Terriglobales bacterium]
MLAVSEDSLRTIIPSRNFEPTHQRIIFIVQVNPERGRHILDDLPDSIAAIVPLDAFAILDCATRWLPADFLEPTASQLNDLYLIVHSVQGLKPGAYFFGREHNALELLKEGKFRAEAHHLGLEQELPADACVDIFFLADLKRILEQYGNRGYRAVQLEAGTIGGRIYLAAYALHLGATGLTFFDDDLISFFSPHAGDKSAIFLLAIGKPLKRKPQ